MREHSLGSSSSSSSSMDRRRKRTRSTSPSPEQQQRRYHHHHHRQQQQQKQLEREKLEEDRRKRMARLRAENEEEERKMASLDSSSATNTITNSNSIHNNHGRDAGPVTIDESELEGLDEEEQMRRMLGFSGGFASTKGLEVEDNQMSAARGAVSKKKARKYRQYMNRKGGFNRPLDNI